MSEPTSSTPPVDAPERRCGRCRKLFPTSGELHPAELKEWWSCSACSAAIIPSHRLTSPAEV